MMNANPKQLVLEKENGLNFYVIPKALMSAKTFTNKVTGEVVDLTMIDKMVLMHLIDMISYHNTNSRTMHESMSAIADAVDTSAKSVSRSVSKLIEHGVVSATLVSKANGYTYHAVDLVQDWNRGEMTEGNKQRMRQPTVEAPMKAVEAIEAPKPSVGVIKTVRQPIEQSGASVDELFDDEYPFP